MQFSLNVVVFKLTNTCPNNFNCSSQFFELNQTSLIRFKILNIQTNESVIKPL